MHAAGHPDPGIAPYQAFDVKFNHYQGDLAASKHTASLRQHAYGPGTKEEKRGPLTYRLALALVLNNELEFASEAFEKYRMWAFRAQDQIAVAQAYGGHGIVKMIQVMALPRRLPPGSFSLYHAPIGSCSR